MNLKLLTNKFMIIPQKKCTFAADIHQTIP